MRCTRVFENDEPLTCEACNSTIYAGDDYLVLKAKGKKYTCCSCEDCMARILLDLYEDDFEDRHLNTKEEKEEIYREMWVDDE